MNLIVGLGELYALRKLFPAAKDKNHAKLIKVEIILEHLGKLLEYWIDNENYHRLMRGKWKGTAFDVHAIKYVDQPQNTRIIMLQNFRKFQPKPPLIIRPDEYWMVYKTE